MTKLAEITLGFEVEPGQRLVAPMGLDTPHAVRLNTEVTGADSTHVPEQNTKQSIILIRATDPKVQVTYRYDIEASKPYSDALFQSHDSRWSRAAQLLVDEVAEVAPEATGAELAEAIACHTAERFTYDHPQEKFTDGLDHVPALGCALTPGSCSDINTYFIAALRSRGIEAGYIVGYFFPEEKGDHCEDMHCWVVTRHGEASLEWDIAHFLKLGTREIKPGLNPKPGFRLATGFGMGLTLPELGIEDVKLICEPAKLALDAPKRLDGLDIRLSMPMVIEV